MKSIAHKFINPLFLIVFFMGFQIACNSEPRVDEVDREAALVEEKRRREADEVWLAEIKKAAPGSSELKQLEIDFQAATSESRLYRVKMLLGSELESLPSINLIQVAQGLKPEELSAIFQFAFAENADGSGPVYSISNLRGILSIYESFGIDLPENSLEKVRSLLALAIETEIPELYNAFVLNDISRVFASNNQVEVILNFIEKENHDGGELEKALIETCSRYPKESKVASYFLGLRLRSSSGRSVVEALEAIGPASIPALIDVLKTEARGYETFVEGSATNKAFSPFNTRIAELLSSFGSQELEAVWPIISFNDLSLKGSQHEIVWEAAAYYLLNLELNESEDVELIERFLADSNPIVQMNASHAARLWVRKKQIVPENLKAALLDYKNQIENADQRAIIEVPLKSGVVAPASLFDSIGRQYVETTLRVK